MAIAVPKLAIAGLIVRIFCPPTTTRVLLWSSVILGLLNYLTVCLFSTFLCIPVAAFWDDSIKNAKCISHGPYSSFAYYSSSKPYCLRHGLGNEWMSLETDCNLYSLLRPRRSLPRSISSCHISRTGFQSAKEDCSELCTRAWRLVRPSPCRFRLARLF